MSDFDSSLPIRTENPGDVIAKIADATIPSQQLKVEADGSINTNISATNLDIRDLVFATDKVDVTGSLVDVQATDLDIRDLSHTQDSVKVGDGTDFLAVNADGSVNITDNGGSLTVDATDLDIRDLNSATDSVTVLATDLDIRDLSHTQDSVKIGDGTDLLSVNADGSLNITDNGGSLTVDATNLDIRDLAFATDKVDVSGSLVDIQATDLDIRDLSHTQDSIKIGDGTDLLAVNADGSINVKIADGSPGTDVCDYNTAAAVAGGASSTHTYTSTGNFYLTQIEASGSGKMKIEVQVNGATKFVQFNSTANPNMQIDLKQPLLATTGQTVTVIRTNRENQAQDVYSTIVGYTV